MERSTQSFEFFVADGRSDPTLHFAQDAATISLRIQFEPVQDRLLMIKCRYKSYDAPVFDKNVMGIVGRHADHALILYTMERPLFRISALAPNWREIPPACSLPS
jgi:hypothetical protein